MEAHWRKLLGTKTKGQWTHKRPNCAVAEGTPAAAVEEALKYRSPSSNIQAATFAFLGDSAEEVLEVMEMPDTYRNAVSQVVALKEITLKLHLEHVGEQASSASDSRRVRPSKRQRRENKHRLNVYSKPLCSMWGPSRRTAWR